MTNKHQTKPSPATVLGGAELSAELEGTLRAAIAQHGASYRPRTRHVRPDGAPEYVNRLILETSPYLLQHAHNPVSWYPWGPEAFEAARRLDRPVLLSVGYSTCHWCHVMEHESFEDEEIAALINNRFIPIKVDREERPDVDATYMAAVMAMTHSGGWPMTVVMAPDGRPFFGGTYFPARDGDRGARMGFATLLRRLSEVWTEDRGRVEAGAHQLTEALKASADRARPQAIPGPEALASAARTLAAHFDPRFGGFGAAPKFPRPCTYELMLRYWRRTEDPAALHVVQRSLLLMSNGGIYDHLAGGFHRYSTDEQWLVPHFEKMLYDNAQLVALLLDAHQATAEPQLAEKARETLDYVLREMTSPEGAFYSATDADSEAAGSPEDPGIGGHSQGPESAEGRFFVWTRGELDDVLGPERARLAAAYWNVSRSGNFEGRNILHRTRPVEELAAELELEVSALEEELTLARSALYAARARRPPPLLDDKILVEWNAQMISAFARAALVLGDARYRKAAETAADFILGALIQDGRLLRTFRAGRARHPAVLEDYAFLVAALLDLFEGTGERRWLDQAIALQAELDRHFLDRRHGAWFGTADDAEALLVREKPTYDGAQPAGGSVATMNVLRLGELTGRPGYRTTAERALQAHGATLERAGLEAPKLAAALDWYLDRPKQLVLVTPPGSRPGDEGSRALLEVVARTYLPNRVFVAVEEGPELESLATLVPMVAGKRALGGSPTMYVCTEGTCKAPATTAEVLEAQLREVEPLPLQRPLTLPRG